MGYVFALWTVLQAGYVRLLHVCVFDVRLKCQSQCFPLLMTGLLSGTFAVVSLMTGSVVEQLVPTPLDLNSSSSEAADFEAQRIGVASAVALLSGIIMVRQKTQYETLMQISWQIFLFVRAIRLTLMLC